MISAFDSPSFVRRSKYAWVFWVVLLADAGDRPQCVVGLAVTAAVEPVSGGFAAGCFHGAGSAQGCEAGVSPEAFGVLAGCDDEL